MTARRITPTPPGHHREPPAPPESLPRLYTPAQAADILAVRESWLRRKAGQRALPCTFLGKHLRFGRQPARHRRLQQPHTPDTTRPPTPHPLTPKNFADTYCPLPPTERPWTCHTNHPPTVSTLSTFRRHDGLVREARQTWRVRYHKDDHTLGSVTGIPTKTSADNYADTLETDQRQGTWIDPAADRIAVAEWADDWLDDWLDALDLSRATETQYRSLVTNHILPRWGETSLADITGLAVAAWRKQLAADYAPSTVTTIVKVLSMMLADAADDKLVPANPIRARRRGKRHREKPRERIWATRQQALRVADNAAALLGPWAGILMITAAWTGARWGELTGLQRHNTHLDDARIVIDPDIGALHERSTATSNSAHPRPPNPPAPSPSHPS